MKYISLLLIALGLNLIDAVCVPTNKCSYTDASIFGFTMQYSYEFEDGDDYNRYYYNNSTDCSGNYEISDDYNAFLVIILA